MGGDRTGIAASFILHEKQSQYMRLVHLCHRWSSLLLLLSAFLWFLKACLPACLRSWDPMASSYKMKGIFKSFKIISHIFAAKEQEMEIGCPTDVKHVAHIGWNTSTGTLTGNAPPSWTHMYSLRSMKYV
ncbi:uncharacterized protein LOC124671672 [Lolium rigidum]|uniref:uncharacterized protein LOC124671672 n=1 Tax=Lolium rigidum TaxID=89674 RepID=UPI001F5D4522|nr:uncharacterized protein LOC124671672 [Lolium rigidum]